MICSKPFVYYQEDDEKWSIQVWNEEICEWVDIKSFDTENDAEAYANTIQSRN